MTFLKKIRLKFLVGNLKKVKLHYITLHYEFV